MYRHSDEMIKKLRGAGLGWRDEEASNNAEKLGTISKHAKYNFIFLNRRNTIKRFSVSSHRIT